MRGKNGCMIATHIREKYLTGSWKSICMPVKISS